MTIHDQTAAGGVAAQPGAHDGPMARVGNAPASMTAGGLGASAGAQDPDTVWYVPFDTRDLLSACEPHPGVAPIGATQPFTVALRSVRIEANPESPLHHVLHGDSDILILSSTALGTQPVVRRVHYYADHLPAKTVLDNFMAEAMYVCPDYSGHDHLWLEVRVMAVDADPKHRQDLVGKFDALASTAGSIFPVVLPYTMIATSLTTAIEKFVEATGENKAVLRCDVSLNPAGHGYQLLRPGSYVLFDRAVVGGDYRLGDDEQLATADGSDVDVSYAVFIVDTVNAPSPEWVMSQRVATLLTQLDQGNPNADTASVGFLNDTLTLYGNFRDLQRYQELKQKDPGALTAAEKGLMARLAQRPELQPFLPQ